MSEIQLLKVEARNNSGLLGGVLFTELNSNVTIMGSNFRNNIASKRGGALYLHNSNVRIVDATFEGNRAPDGGGAVFAEGSLPSTLISENVSFSGNGAQKQGGISGAGGAVALMGPQLTAEIKTTLFIRNFAAFMGGGLMVNHGKNMSILDCHFIENYAVAGGALLAQGVEPNITKLEVKGTTFESNSARGNVAGFSNNSGGAIALMGNGTFVKILDASFSDNMAESGRGLGGAISGTEIKSIEISRSTFNRNQVAEAKHLVEDDNGEQEKKVQTEEEINISNGGAISLNDIPVISIQNSTFTANQALIGGAIDIINPEKESDATIVECIFDGNEADVGESGFKVGGALALSGASGIKGLRALIQRSNFTNNKAGRSGGAVYGLEISSIEISHSSFIGNKLVGSGENNVSVDSVNETRTLDNVDITEGGAIVLGEVSETTITNSIFFHNEATHGGGIYVSKLQNNDTDGSILGIESSVFRHNVGRQYGGGAMFVGGDGIEASIKNSKFENNTSENGGGICSVHTLLNINKTNFTGNSATGGGALSLELSTNTSITECFFIENIVKNVGGAISASSADGLSEFFPERIRAASFEESMLLQIFVTGRSLLSLETSVFNNNEARESGGAIHLQGPSLNCSMRGSKFRENISNYGGAVDIISGATVNVSHCSFTNNTSTESGAAMATTFSTLFIHGSNFTDNLGMLHGGAISLLSTNVTISQSDFTRNVGIKAGAVFSLHTKSHQVQHLNNEEIAETNTTNSLFGGTILPPTERKRLEKAVFPGLELIRQSDVFLTTSNVEFKHNRVVSGSGGALFLGGVDLELEGGIFQNNSASDNGGAVYLIQFEGSTPNATIRSGTFIANQAMLGGGVFLQNRDLYMSHCDFQSNIARNGGGALHCEDSGLNLVQGQRDSVVAVQSCEFSGNKAGASQKGKELTSINGRGGAVLMSGLGLLLDINKCKFLDCAAGSGGAVYMQDVKKLTVNDSNFLMGSALTGGALTVISAGDSFAANNVSFVGNAARWGGALSLSFSLGTRFDWVLEGPVSLTHVHFLENVATRGGGAIDVKERTVECASCFFDSNSAGVDGGALRALSTSNLTLVDTSIVNCTASRSGGGMYLEDVLFLGENVTILNSAAGQNGGGLAVQFGTFAGNQLVPWKCSSCRIQENRAIKGGGMLVSSDESAHEDCRGLDPTSSTKNQHQRLELLADCQRRPPKTASRESQVLLDKTTFEGNMAESSGSHIFLSNFKRTICCDDWCWSMETEVNETVEKCGFKEGVFQTRGKQSAPLGTLLEQVLISPSEVNEHASGKELPPVTVRALDSFGQIALDNGNLKTRVGTLGGELFGNPVTSDGVLMSGNITVTGIIMRALPGNYKLSFELTSEDGNREVNVTMLVEIRECVIGEVSREDGLRCERCADDFFSFDVTDENCGQCPEETAKCSGGALAPLDGFWHSGPRSSQLHACLTEEACTYPNRTNILFAYNSTGDYPQCAEGYRDILCGSCDTSHGKSRFECTACEGSVRGGLGIGAVMLALAVLSLIFVKSAAKYSQQVLGAQSNITSQNPAQSSSQIGQHSLSDTLISHEEWPDQQKSNQNKQQKRGSDIFKILVNFLQVTGSAAAINVGWTGSVMTLFTTWDMISGVADGNSFFSFDCAFAAGKNGLSRSIKASVLLGFIPIIVWVTIILVYAAYALKTKKSFQKFKLWSCVALLAVLQASYISATRTFVRIFYCVDASPMKGLFWVQDTSVVCYSGSHAFLVGFVGAPGLALISIGFPGWLLFKLMRSSESLEQEGVVNLYGSLYRAYKKNAAAWEVVILLRKALLAAIVVFGRTLGQGIQGNLALVVMMGSIILQLLTQPFLESKLNFLELGSLTISTLAFIIGNLLDQAKMTEGGRVAMSFVFIGVVGIYIAYVLKQLLDAAFIEFREKMEMEYPGYPFPTSNIKLLFVAVKLHTKKAQAIYKEKKALLMVKLSSQN
ncbi:hypothetical protein BSKO_06777 [Bryopsis sp. KO-2023]|nr:hypothetical protein BSKO_06777 [Bryopsis sp. KO-2023]